MEEMQVRVMKTGAHQGIAQIHHRRVRARLRLHAIELVHIRDAIARDRERQRVHGRRAGSRGEHALRAHDVISLESHAKPPYQK